MNQGGVKFPQTVPAGCVFVMGDNRNDSLDSRSSTIGFVDEREILGKAFFLFLPGTDHGAQERDYSRMGGLN
jgi:signal peptidase I